jgi:hypothetical protein
MKLYYSMPYDFYLRNYIPMEIIRCIPDNNDEKRKFIEYTSSFEKQPIHYYSLTGLLMKKMLYSYIFLVDILEDEETEKENSIDYIKEYGWTNYYKKLGTLNQQIIETDNARAYLWYKLKKEFVKSNSINSVTLLNTWNYSKYLKFSYMIIEDMVKDQGGFGVETDKLISKTIDLLEKRSQLYEKYYSIVSDGVTINQLDVFDTLRNSKSFNKNEYEQYISNDNGLRDDLQNIAHINHYVGNIIESACFGLSDSHLNEIHDSCRMLYTMKHIKRHLYTNGDSSNQEFIDLQLEFAYNKSQIIKNILFE